MSKEQIQRLVGVVVTMVLAVMAGFGWYFPIDVPEPVEIDAQGVHYGQYGNMAVHGDILADGDIAIDGTANLDDMDIDLSSEFEIDGALTDFGGCTAGVADGDNDVCIAAVLEVDGEIEADGAIDADSDLDVDGTTNLDVVDIDGAVDFGGQELDLDADNDTSITADTDDQIDIEINGADDFQFTANSFTILAGSKIKSANVTTGTHGVVFSCSGTHTHASTEDAVEICSIPANANIVDTAYQITTDWNDGASATVDCGISGGDTDAFIDGLDLNGVGTLHSRAGDAAENETISALIDVGSSDVTVVCQVAEGDNDATEGAATLYLWYIID